MKRFPPSLIAVLSLACFGVNASIAGQQAAKNQSRPNILFFVVDDLGWRDAGCYGRQEWATPHMDRLARSGCRFTNAYAMPLCSPTRSMLLSGKHCVRFGITDWMPGFPPPEDSKLLTPSMTGGLPAEEVTFAEAFSEAGYITGHVGKWHVGDVPPEEQGFQSVAETGVPHWDRKTKQFTEDAKVEAAIDFLRDNQHKPFFLYLCLSSVHVPIMASPEKEAQHADAPNPTYAAMVDHADEYFGRVMQVLRELDLVKNTIVILYSDNGGVVRCNFKSKAKTSNLPLRGNKGSVYEGGIRVPLIVSQPGVIKAGSVCDALVGPADFYPTLLEMAGLRLRPEQHLDGVSFAGVFRGEAGQRHKLRWHYPHYSRHTMGFPSGAIRQDDWKLIEWFGQTSENGKTRVELFNLVEDLGEQNDLADHFPAIRDSLLEQLRNWRKQTGALMPTPRGS